MGSKQQSQKTHLSKSVLTVRSHSEVSFFSHESFKQDFLQSMIFDI